MQPLPTRAIEGPLQLRPEGWVIIYRTMKKLANPISMYPARALSLPAALLIGVSALAGCRHAEYQRVAEQRREKRAASLTWAANSLAESEKRRPANLARAEEYIGRDLRRDAAQFQYALEWSAFWLERDAQRVRARAPIYLDRFGRIMWSKPDEVPTSAILLFY